MSSAKAYYIVDPLDRWIRVTYLAEIYHEPISSLHDFVKEMGLTLHYRGTVVYINEREYQTAISSLPTTRKSPTENETPARRNIRNPKVRPDPLPRQSERRPRLRKSEGDEN